MTTQPPGDPETPGVEPPAAPQPPMPPPPDASGGYLPPTPPGSPPAPPPMEGYYPPVTRVAGTRLPSDGPASQPPAAPAGQFPPGNYPAPPAGAYPPPAASYPPPPPGAYPAGPVGGYPGSAPVGYAPTAGPTTNGWAIAALVCGLLSLLTGVTAILAVIFGFIALSQIKKSGDQGRGMAIAGLVIGFVVLAISIIGIILAVAFFGWFISNVDVQRLPVQANLIAASAAQESYQDTYGRYAETMTELRTTGMVPSSGPVITIVYASETGFCMEGTQSGQTYFVMQNGLPSVGSCLLQ